MTNGIRQKGVCVKPEARPARCNFLLAFLNCFLWGEPVGWHCGTLMHPGRGPRGEELSLPLGASAALLATRVSHLES